MNTVITTLFSDSSEKAFHKTLDTFWSEYTNFNQNIDLFYSNKFIWSSKDIHDDISHLWHQKYYLPSTKFLGFLACRVTSKVLVVGYSEHSWDNI